MFFIPNESYLLSFIFKTYEQIKAFTSSHLHILHGKSSFQLNTDALFQSFCACLAVNPCVPNAPFLCPLKTSENRNCFQGVEKGCNESEWVKRINSKCNARYHKKTYEFISFLKNSVFMAKYAVLQLIKYGNRTLLQTLECIVTLHKKSQSFLRIWSHWLEKSLIENFVFCTVRVS